jgi:hypothetical protein
MWGNYPKSYVKLMYNINKKLNKKFTKFISYIVKYIDPKKPEINNYKEFCQKILNV